MWKVPFAQRASHSLRLRSCDFRCALCFLLGLVALSARAFAAEPATEKNVLIFESFSVPSIGTADALVSELRARARWPVNFYIEYLEGQRFGDEDYKKDLVGTLRHTYREKKLDLVMPESYPAFEFVLEHYDELFPGVPIVFWDVDVTRKIRQQKTGPSFTGVTVTQDVSGTIDLVLHLQPDTSSIAVVTNNSPFEAYWLKVIHSELLHYQSKVREIDLVALPTNQLFEKIDALPSKSVILFYEGPQASLHPELGPYDLLSWIAKRRPTYCLALGVCFDHGGIGSITQDTQREVSLAAELARRVLSGERPESIPLQNGTKNVVQVDWRELRRWHIPELALPSGTVVLHREPTLWERYRKYIVAAFLIIVIQSLLIVGLLWQRARKQKAEAILRESERRFRVMANTTPSLIWMCDEKGKATFMNDRRVEFTGPTENSGYGETWSAAVHPDDREVVSEALTTALKNRNSFSREYRLRRRDGVYRWMFDVASPRVNGDGSFAGFVGSAVDVTDQKMAREALEKLSGQLIAAQEKERSLIARELHDDICQRLAMLSLRIEKVTKGWDSGQVHLGDQLEQIWQQCSTLTGDVQALSHELHPSILDNLGLVTAAKSFCRELSEQSGATIEFIFKNVPAFLSREVSLSLFRVIQEALHNAVKYSGQNHFEVHLEGISGELELEIIDRGLGFDATNVKSMDGLGLVSMSERIHLLNGRFNIETKPNQGTRIYARVPITVRSNAVGAD
jgi:PAS domain S-box-containing protein